MNSSVVIIVVEDESLIRDLVVLALEDGGFVPIGARDGHEAIAMLEADDTKCGGLVSDINLGKGPTGWDVARRARELNGALPVVYMTGGNGHEWSAKGVPHSVVISKPFAPVQVVMAMSQLIDIHNL